MLKIAYQLGVQTAVEETDVEQEKQALSLAGARKALGNYLNPMRSGARKALGNYLNLMRSGVGNIGMGARIGAAGEKDVLKRLLGELRGASSKVLGPTGAERKALLGTAGGVAGLGGLGALAAGGGEKE